MKLKNEKQRNIQNLYLNIQIIQQLQMKEVITLEIQHKKRYRDTALKFEGVDIYI